MQENRVIILLPSYCIAPDGTILWATEMKCGCKLTKVLDHKFESSQIEILTIACDEHYRKIFLSTNADTIKFKHYQGEMIPYGTTDDLE